MTLRRLWTLGKNPTNLLHTKRKLAGLWAVMYVKRMRVGGIEPLYSNCRRVTPTHVILYATGSWLMCTWCMRFLTASLFKLLGLRLLQQCWWALQSSGCDAMYLRRLVYRYESFERACCLRLWRHSRRRTAVKMEAANLPKRWRPYTCLHHVELE